MCQWVKLGQYKYACISTTESHPSADWDYNLNLSKISHLLLVRLKVNFRRWTLAKMVCFCSTLSATCPSYFLHKLYLQYLQVLFPLQEVETAMQVMQMHSKLIFHCFVNVEVLNNLSIWHSQFPHVGSQANWHFHRQHNISPAHTAAVRPNSSDNSISNAGVWSNTLFRAAAHTVVINCVLNTQA